MERRLIRYNHTMKCLLMILLVATLLLGGCGEYTTFKITKGIAHFSFEYPAYYLRGLTETRDDEYVYTTLSIRGGGTKLASGDIHNNYISMLVQPQDETWKNPMQYLEYTIEFHTSRVPEVFENFVIVDSSNVTVGNITGQQIIYSYDAKAYEHEWDAWDEPLYKYPVLCRDVCFIANGLVWDIGLMSSPEAAEKANSVLNHILETFTFLD